METSLKIAFVLGIFIPSLIRASQIPGEEFDPVVVHGCYDGDTCTVSIPNLPPLFGEKIKVRLLGIDTPEIEGRCEQESSKAIEARNYLNTEIKKANSIKLTEMGRGKYFRLTSRILIDGQDASELMIKQGFAKPWPGKGPKPRWCPSSPSRSANMKNQNK